MLALFSKCFIIAYVFRECTSDSSLLPRNAPLSIPRELVFNSSLSSHRRIIRKLMEQPSTLAHRIQLLSNYFYKNSFDETERKDPVLNLFIDHIPLINLYLLSSPVRV